MSLNVISLYDMLRSIPAEEDIKDLLHSFSTLNNQDSSGAQDVEYFLHNNAIHFEKLDLSRTYLILSTYRSKPILVGYFSISNKPLSIPNKQFRKLSKTFQKRLTGMGTRGEQSSYVIKGYLIGQLGKNYSEEALRANCCSGNDILHIAYRKLSEAHRVVGGRIIYLECENVDKVLYFYKSNGFSQIDGYESEMVTA